MAAPAIGRLIRGTTDRESYEAFLTEYFHLLRGAVPALRRAAGRLPPRLDWLREEIARYSEEESRRAERIPGDVRSAGGDPAAARESPPTAPTRALVDWLDAVAAGSQPVATCGTLFVLDATGLILGTSAAGRVQEHLGLPDGALTFLRGDATIHREHLRWVQRILDRLADAQDRRAVARAAVTTYRLLGDVLCQLSPRPPGRPRVAARPGGTARHRPALPC